MSEFVPFEIAKKLKEKGFKEKCLTYYDAIDNVGLLYNTQYTNDLSPCQYTDLLQSHNTDVSAYLSDDSEYCVDAPTISQVLKWLREEKKIHIGVLYHNYYAVWIQPMKRNEAEHVIHDCKTHEGAELEGIEFVLDNLI